MVTKHVKIPERQAEFIREMIAAGRFKDLDEVIRAGVLLLEERVAREVQQKEKLRKMLDNAFAGGVVDESFGEIWDAAEKRYLNDNA